MLIPKELAKAIYGTKFTINLKGVTGQIMSSLPNGKDGIMIMKLLEKVFGLKYLVDTIDNRFKVQFSFGYIVDKLYPVGIPLPVNVTYNADAESFTTHMVIEFSNNIERDMCATAMKTLYAVAQPITEGFVEVSIDQSVEKNLHVNIVANADADFDDLDKIRIKMAIENVNLFFEDEPLMKWFPPESKANNENEDPDYNPDFEGPSAEELREAAEIEAADRAAEAKIAEKYELKSPYLTPSDPPPPVEVRVVFEDEDAKRAKALADFRAKLTKNDQPKI